jgi:hypothetical protein
MTSSGAPSALATSDATGTPPRGQAQHHHRLGAQILQPRGQAAARETIGEEHSGLPSAMVHHPAQHPVGARADGPRAGVSRS